MSQRIPRMIQVWNNIAPNKIMTSSSTSLSSRPLPNDWLKIFTNNDPKPKPKSKGVVGPCLKCKGIGHISRDYPTKLDRNSKLLHSKFSFWSWEEDYESGDVEDVSYTKKAILCLMSQSQTSEYSDQEDETSIDWKILYGIE